MLMEKRGAASELFLLYLVCGDVGVNIVVRKKKQSGADGANMTFDLLTDHPCRVVSLVVGALFINLTLFFIMRMRF